MPSVSPKSSAATAAHCGSTWRESAAWISPPTGYAPRPEHFLVAVEESEYLDAAFLRASSTSTPIRLDGPPGTLMLHTSMPGPRGTAVVAHVDDTGRLLWRADTGISRSALQQILPGADATAFVGTRPPVPGKVSEPLLVIIEHDSGRQVTHSLWQRRFRKGVQAANAGSTSPAG